MNIPILHRVRQKLRPLLLRAAGENPADLAKLKSWGKPSFEGHGLRSYWKNLSWLDESHFKDAYETGINSGHRFNCLPDLDLRWHVQHILFAAQQGLNRPGDFVECGVNTGIFSLAVCKYLNFATQPRKFYLFDTYEGIPESQMSESEKEKRIKENQAFYEDCYEIVKQNFSPWPNAHLVKGLVPDTLTTVDIQQVAYLSIDMNIAKPERDALEFFWPKLVSGAFVVLDDYGWANYSEQKKTLDEFARAHNVPICPLPTGQGIIVKP